MGRIGVAISPSAPSVVYAVLTNTSEAVRGIYRTTNGGAAWTSLGVDASGVTGSSSYTLDIAVDPSTPDIVYVAGTSLYKATRNTATGAWSLAEIGADIHPDMHYIAFDPVDHLVVYAGTDGGIYRSSDGGVSWSDAINQGLCITQFQVVDHHPTSDAFVIGGTQDNGTEQYRNSPVFYHSDDGDGGFVAVDPAHPRTLFHTYYSLSLARSTQMGNYGSWFDVTPGLRATPSSTRLLRLTLPTRATSPMAPTASAWTTRKASTNGPPRWHFRGSQDAYPLFVMSTLRSFTRAPARVRYTG